MGKTSKPVRILVLDRDLFESPEVQALIEKGHPVELAGQFHCCSDSRQPTDYDLILGRRAWYCDAKHLKYVEKIAIPSARTRIDYREKEKVKK
jgi:hypothetical protein